MPRGRAALRARKSKSTTVPQLSHAITSHGCLAVIAAAIFGPEPRRTLGEGEWWSRGEASLLRRNPVKSGAFEMWHTPCMLALCTIAKYAVAQFAALRAAQ
jgi:hypothetical protein